jgi:molecular chaperone HtpG
VAVALDHHQVFRPHHPARDDAGAEVQRRQGCATEIEEERINQAAALWARPKQDIKEEEYKEFYKHVGHDFEDPLAWTHNRVEGKLEYTSLLFIPARAPFDLWDREQRHGVKLYVQRVFIMDDAEHLMPRYLRFVRGVIDSNDLPLNISREILQGSKIVDGIRAGSVKKVLGLLEDMAPTTPRNTASSGKNSGGRSRKGRRRITAIVSKSPSCCALPRLTPTAPIRPSR